MLLSLFGEKVHLIKSCHTDDSQALIGRIEKAGIGNILCGFHISLNCPASNLIKLLISSKTSKEYDEIKQEIITKYPDLDLYLKDGSRWKKLVDLNQIYHDILILQRHRSNHSMQ